MSDQSTWNTNDPAFVPIVLLEELKTAWMKRVQFYHGTDYAKVFLSCVTELDGVINDIKARCQKCGNYLPGHATGAIDICDCSFGDRP